VVASGAPVLGLSEPDGRERSRPEQLFHRSGRPVPGMAAAAAAGMCTASPAGTTTPATAEPPPSRPPAATYAVIDSPAPATVSSTRRCT